LTISIILSACRPSTTKQAEISQSEEMDEQSVKRQIDLMVENRECWLKECSEDIYAPYYYTVTDLDGNGLMEVIFSSCQGTGQFSTNRFYEVDESMEGIQMCECLLVEEDSQPDIIMNELERYLNLETGVWQYIVMDTGRWNAKTEVLSLQDGRVSVEILGEERVVDLDGDHSAIAYSDVQGRPLSEEEYNKIIEERFQGNQKSIVNLQWNEFLGDDDLISDTELMQRLIDSYQVFAGKKMDKN